MRQRCCARLVVLLAMSIVAPVRGHAQAPAGPARATVVVGHDSLALWSRTAAKPKGVVLLLHGRTWSALPDFDLQVPGERRSVLEALRDKGYAAYALDLPGYGASPRDASGWLTPTRAAQDVAGVLEWLATRHPGMPRPVLVGWSNGSMVAHLTAQQRPELLSALVLYGYPFDLRATITPPALPAAPPRAANTAANAASDFIRPDVISRHAIDVYVAAALAADPVRSDWRELQEWNDLRAEGIVTPTLVLNGEFDPLTPVDALARLFTRLGTSDRQWIVLAGGDHAALVEDTQPAFVAAIVNFIERPRLGSARP